MISRDPLPQIEPLVGTLQRAWKRCGASTCRCASGALHGPYWSRRWRSNGAQRRMYVPAARVAEVQAAIDLWHRLHARPWAVRQALAELRHLEEETLCLL